MCKLHPIPLYIDLDLTEFPACCGIGVITNFPKDSDICHCTPRANIREAVLRSLQSPEMSHRGIAMAATTANQKISGEVLAELEFVALWTFKNPNSGNVVTLWMLPLTNGKSVTRTWKVPKAAKRQKKLQF